jgi:hypothetical protein
MKRKLLGTALAALAIVGLMAGTSFAADQPGSKTGARMSSSVLIEATQKTESWDPIMIATLKVPEQKELVFNVAIQCGIWTRTLASSKGGNKDKSTAEASVHVRVKVEDEDGNVIFAGPSEELGSSIYDPNDPTHTGPAGVTFCSRVQELSATFQGIFQTEDTFSAYIVTVDANDDGDLGETVRDCDAGDTCELLLVVTVDGDNSGNLGETVTSCPDGDQCEAKIFAGTCLSQDPNSGAIILDLECLEPEEVELVLHSLNANAFNFVAPNLSSGVYTATVEVEITSSTNVQEGEAEAMALVGLGSVIVDQVRFIQNETGN